MAEDDRLSRRWQKLARHETPSDTMQLLRVSIAEVRNAPRDPEARRRLRARAAEHSLRDQLAALPGDGARAEAWRSLDDLLTELGRWPELAEMRGRRAARAERGVEKAALLRSQARAFEQAGAQQDAAAVVAQAAEHAPDDISGMVDYAEVLA